MDTTTFVDVPPHIRLVAEVTLRDDQGKFFVALLSFDKVPTEGSPLQQLETLINGVIEQHPEYAIPTAEEISQRKKRAYIEHLAERLEQADWPIDPEMVN